MIKQLVRVSVAALAVAAMGVLAGRGVAAVSVGEGAKPPIGFSAGAGSIAELVELYTAAIRKRDEAGLRLLRITEDEYRKIIVPGTVERGKSPRRVSESVQTYFWRDMDYKSELYKDQLFKRFGDRPLPEYKIVFTKDPVTYDWYRAWGELRVDYEDDLKTAIPSGWIAEVDGRYKFLSFEWDY